MITTSLPKGLEESRKIIEEVARECGLDFFQTQFHMLDFEKLNEVTANVGFPRRYMHWRFGMEYGKLMKQLGHGFGRLYELVINTNPAIAYLLSYNKKIQQEMVIAHVYGHVDFFKNNMAFAKTDRNMMNTMADHAELIHRHYQKLGLQPVESFIDHALSIENLVDPFFDQITKPKKKKKGKCQKNKEKSRLNVDPYLEGFVKDAFEPKQKKKKKKRPKNIFKWTGDRDVLKFIIDNADHLAFWQKDILSIVREERCYFIPQVKTKILNEGWATFWHSYLMSTKMLAGDAGIFDFADTHSGVVGSLVPPKGSVQLGLNPYTLGFMLFNDIKERWDKGKYGLDYEEEKDINKKKKWNTGEMNGMKKIFDVRRYKTDVGFIREFFTDEFIMKNLFFMYGPDSSERYDIIKSKQPEKIRNYLVNMLEDHNEPIIKAVDGNYHNQKDLLLKHEYLGQELHPLYMKETLKNIQKIWKRPVFLMTHVDDDPVLAGYNGKDFKAKKWK